jgi:hypothetical protein
MKWYAFDPIVNDYWGIVRLNETDPFLFELEDLSPDGMKGWKPPRVKLAKEGGRKRGDFPCFSSFPPIFTANALELLKPLISQCTILSLICDEEPLVAINPPMLFNALDPDESTVDWFEEGKRAMTIEKYVFHRDEVSRHPIFRLRELENVSIVSEEFREAVEKNKLKGLYFQPLDAEWKP